MDHQAIHQAVHALYMPLLSTAHTESICVNSFGHRKLFTCLLSVENVGLVGLCHVQGVPKLSQTRCITSNVRATQHPHPAPNLPAVLWQIESISQEIIG